MDELIDRYGEPPKAVMGLVNVALTRNRAARMHIKEITQRGSKMLFFIDQPQVCHIQALSKRYKNRIRFVDTGKRHFAVALDKKQLPAQLMLEVIDLMAAAQ